MRRVLVSAGRLLAVLVAISIVAAGCAGERPTLEDSGAAREVDLDADLDQLTDEDPLTVEAIEPVTLRLGVGTEWTGVPADAGPASLVSRVLADLLHEGLTRIGDDGDVEAGLAERWFVTEDRLTWTFVFPDDLVDGLGVPLDARNVMHSLEAVAARGGSDQAATALTMISGWTAHMGGESGGVAGISAPDDTTLVIQLDRPYELLLLALASPAFGITGSTDDGAIRTTGAYAYADDPNLLEAVDPDAAVRRIELVRVDGDGVDLLAEERVDWVVLRSGQGGDSLPGDIIRQPLDVRIGVVVRLPDPVQRTALLSAINPLLLADPIVLLNPLINEVAAEEPVGLPELVTIDYPTGLLAPIGEGLVAQLEALGVEVLPVASEPAEFARRIASGEATIYPVVLAGGGLEGDAVLRVSASGGVDDVLGSPSEERAEMVAAIENEDDDDRRQTMIDALEAVLLEDGLLLPVGQFEVRVGIGPDMDGLRHRVDGTLDLSLID